jgi:hypothetical protein
MLSNKFSRVLHLVLQPPLIIAIANQSIAGLTTYQFIRRERIVGSDGIIGMPIIYK